jgi:bifunctional non-homologous end joining protein LigD
MNALTKTSLYYSEGNSDKEYHAEIVEVAGGNVVNFRYGRRGGSLTVGTKTSAPVDFAQAKKIYDKLVKEKTAKGYTPDVSGSAYQGTENVGIKTDFMPQLLNAITESETMACISDANWAAQEKMDGERRAVHADAKVPENHFGASAIKKMTAEDKAQIQDKRKNKKQIA